MTKPPDTRALHDRSACSGITDQLDGRYVAPRRFDAYEVPAFLRRVAAEAGMVLPERFAAGMLFLPVDEARAEKVRAELARQLDAVGVALLGWRAVPVDNRVCGAMAKRSLPSSKSVGFRFRRKLLAKRMVRKSRSSTSASCTSAPGLRSARNLFGDLERKAWSDPAGRRHRAFPTHRRMPPRRSGIRAGPGRCR